MKSVELQGALKFRDTLLRITKENDWVEDLKMYCETIICNMEEDAQLELDEMEKFNNLLDEVIK